MKRKKLSGPSVTMSDWLAFRPYDHATVYDKFYLDLANLVFSFLNERELGIRDMFERKLIIKTSVVAVSHFEDFINELGLWSAFVRKQKELFGWYLPFYERQDYDEDYINSEDYAFLIWHTLQTGSTKAIDPMANPILATAGFCYSLFEMKIDDAPVNGFYDEWFGFGEEIEFFPLKNRLQWLAFDSYLFGPEMRPRWAEAVEKSVSGKDNLNSLLPPDKLAYFMEDDYLYTKRSSLCGLTIAEWMAEWKGIHAIRKLGQRVGGFFVYEGKEGKYVHFRYLSSKRLFLIREESADFPMHQMKPGRELAYFNAVEWNGDWWLTGIFFTYPADPAYLAEMRTHQLNRNFFGQTEETQQTLRDMAKEMEAGFLEFFGDRLVFFASQTEMSEALENQARWWNDHKAKKPGKRPPSPYLDKIRKTLKGSGGEIKPIPGPWLAYFEPGEGVNMSPAIPEIVKYLQRENLDAKESAGLFYSFFRECTPSLARLLAERYTLRNLKPPLVSEPGATEKYFDFFLRYYHPDAFVERKPNMMLAPEE